MSRPFLCKFQSAQSSGQGVNRERLQRPRGRSIRSHSLAPSVPLVRGVEQGAKCTAGACPPTFVRTGSFPQDLLRRRRLDEGLYRGDYGNRGLQGGPSPYRTGGLMREDTDVRRGRTAWRFPSALVEYAVLFRTGRSSETPSLYRLGSRPDFTSGFADLSLRPRADASRF